MKAEKKNLSSRPPIVVVLGHVDHGKTTLLDYLRKTRVAEKEAGGITQSIGASVIEHPSTHSTEAQGGEQRRTTRASTEASVESAETLSRTSSGQARRITFIDTPGHEAFSKMRERGAKVADVAVLVIAADEGMKPQTEEALRQIKDAKLPFVVALNKIDKPEVNIERVKRQLAEKEVYVEGWGGNVPLAEISAKSGQGIDQFLDLLLLLSDLEERPYKSDEPASGFVLESHHDRRRGITAVLVITDGTLHKSDAIIAGQTVGKVKILEDFRRKPAVAISASDPALVVGWEGLPQVGSSFQAGKDAVVLLQPVSLSKEGGVSIAPVSENILAIVVIKAASSGALEALAASIKNITVAEKQPFVLDSGIGEVNESDVKRASAARAMILAFGVDVRPEAKRLAEAGVVEILSEDVIYRLIEKFVEEMRHRAEVSREPSGEARIIAFFREETGGKIFGARMLRGKIIAGKALAFRGSRELGEINILNLKGGKQDIGEIEGEGKEFGLLLPADLKIETGDVLRQFI